MDLTECTNLIRPQEVFEDTYVFFNPELLRIELGFSKEEFNKYEDEVKKMVEELNKKPEEFELKYIIDEDYNDLNLLNDLIDVYGADNNEELMKRRKKDLEKNNNNNKEIREVYIDEVSFF